MDRDEDILNYLQGRLQPVDRARFEADMSRDATLAADVALMRDVRADLASGPRHEAADAVWSRLSAAIDAAPRAANQNRPFWTQAARYAAVAAVAVVSWQFGVAPLITASPDVYRSASEGRSGFVLQVRFTDAATLGDITILLVDVGGTIVDGPSALGFMRVSFADDAAREQALDTLQARSDLVTIVQMQ